MGTFTSECLRTCESGAVWTKGWDQGSLPAQEFPKWQGRPPLLQEGCGDRKWMLPP